MSADQASSWIEKSTINSIIQGGTEAMHDAVLVLDRNTDLFTYQMHQQAYGILCEMYDRGVEINKISFYGELLRRKIDKKRCDDYLSSISKADIFTVKESYLALKDKALGRNLDAAVSSVISDIRDQRYTNHDILYKLQRIVEQQAEIHVPDDSKPICDIVDKTALSIEESCRIRRTGKLPGIASNFKTLDTITGGLKASDLVVVAGRPSMGKTAFMLSYALNAARDGEPILIFSLEMSKEALVKRLTSQVSGIDLSCIMNGELTDLGLHRVNGALREIAKLPVYIDDTSGLDLTMMRAKIMKYMRKSKIKAVFVDYLGLMRMPKAGSREQEVAQTTGKLKAMAKEFNIPIVTLAQLNRTSAQREDKRPEMSDLRESGAIEQDADVVMLVHRPEFVGKTEYKDGSSTRNVGEILIAKQRNGPVGDVRLTYNKRCAQFLNYDEDFQFEDKNEEPIPF